MHTFKLRPFFTLLMFLGTAQVLWAQQQQGQGPPRDSTQQQQPQALTMDKIQKPPRDFKPSMVKLSYDLIPLGTGLFTDTKQGQGFQAAIDFDKYFFDVEFGTQQTHRGDSYKYTNQGHYFSFGPEVNLMQKDHDGNSLTFGLRYGHAGFHDRLVYDLDSTFFGDFHVNQSNPNLRANWLELTAGLNAHVYKGFYMGYTVRYKVLRKVKGMGEMAPYDVPGFGLYEDNTGVQFNFYISWVIKLRDKYPASSLDGASFETTPAPADKTPNKPQPGGKSSGNR